MHCTDVCVFKVSFYYMACVNIARKGTPHRGVVHADECYNHYHQQLSEKDKRVRAMIAYFAARRFQLVRSEINKYGFVLTKIFKTLLI